MDFLTHPAIIIIIVLAVVIGNLLALKYTANMTWVKKDNTTKGSNNDPFVELKEKMDASTKDNKSPPPKN